MLGVLQDKNTFTHPRDRGITARPGPLWLLLDYLRSIGGYANTHKRKNHWVGPVAWARFLEGDMEALRASLY